MPYLEENNLYNLWNMPLTYYEQSDAARKTPVKSYFCPSRRTSSTPPTVSISGDQDDDTNPTLGPHTPGALGDYGVCIGTEGCDGFDCEGTANGSFRIDVVQGPVTFTSITDGLSNTIFAGDKNAPRYLFGAARLIALYNGDYPTARVRAGPNFRRYLAKLPQPHCQPIRIPRRISRCPSLQPPHGHLQFPIWRWRRAARFCGHDPNTLGCSRRSDGKVVPEY